jgi:uncharacterized metal-binding protein YceD (DUF177 family)
MTDPAPEFSRLVPLARLGSEPFRQRIEANSDERAELARRFGLFALDRLTAAVELRRQDAENVLLEAAFEAEFVQDCVVSLDPVWGAVAHRFSLVYGPAEAAEPATARVGEDAAFEPLSGDAIDIGEAVAQELSLSLPDFPRRPDAVIDVPMSAEPGERSFASLARLRHRGEC